MIKELSEKLIKEHVKLREIEKKTVLQKKVVEELKEEMMSAMDEVGTMTHKSDVGTISMTKHEIPNVEDWDKLYKFIDEHKAFDMLQRRVTATAWKDRLENGVEVPGITKMTQNRLRIAAN